jgi:hypothetical protein
LHKTVKGVLYGVIVFVGLIALYAIFNAGNPASLLRRFFPDPRHDIYVAMAASVLVFILGFFVFFDRDQANLKQLIQLNSETVRSLRQAGKSDAEIAESMLAAMGSYSGYRHNLARKKLIVALSVFK